MDEKRKKQIEEQAVAIEKYHYDETLRTFSEYLEKCKTHSDYNECRAFQAWSIKKISDLECSVLQLTHMVSGLADKVKEAGTAQKASSDL